jgi:hypothetical protein
MKKSQELEDYIRSNYDLKSELIAVNWLKLDERKLESNNERIKMQIMIIRFGSNIRREMMISQEA